ncbi:MAG: penicillin-binding protein [Patescibacteria group bacterium]
MPNTQLPPYQKTWRVANAEEKPQPTAKKPRPRFWWWRRALVVAAILVLLGGIVVVGAFAWFSRDLPDPNKLLTRNVAQSTRIYDRTGTQILYEIHGDVKRTLVSLEEIPANLKNATIAIEDKHFYEHSGFDITGLIRAVVINITSVGRSRPGGSTITQQLVKNAILTSEKSYTRKIKELVLSYQIERKFSKDQILKLYFNEIPYGSVAYGVESASQIYFGKSARDLNLAESAILAALPQSPTYYSPYGSHVDDLIGRQHYILDLMVEQRYITAEQAAEAKAFPIEFKPLHENITAPHFVFYVKELLTEKYGEKMVEQGGLKVTTTLDTFKQEAAEKAVTDGMAKVRQYNGSNASLVALDPKTGEILSLVGSADYFDTEHDGNVNVALRPRQPGSSFKPIVYATAFSKGYSPQTMLFDVTTNFGDYTPHNYDGREHGPVSMRQALAGSLNIPAVKTLYLAGLKNVLENAHAMGYSTLNDEDRYGLSLVLGGGEVKLLEHVSAFSVFAREGLRHPTAAIIKVEDKDGKVLEEFKPEESRVLDEEVARNINSILTDNNARSFIFGSRSPLILSDRVVAAKTGTTNDFRDAWTIGYTPSLAAGVWVGNNDNTEMKSGADGVVVAAPIWHQFMATLLTGTPSETFKPPKSINTDKMMLNGQIDEVHTVKVDSLTGRVIPDECLDTYPKEYIAEKTYKETHTILYYVNKDKPLDPAPSDPQKDPQFSRWEEGVQRWAAGQPGYVTSSKPLEKESCSLRKGGSKEKDAVAVLSPADNAVITSSPLKITVRVDASYKLDRAELYLDSTKLGSLTESPYSLEADVSKNTNGFYT